MKYRVEFKSDYTIASGGKADVIIEAETHAVHGDWLVFYNSVLPPWGISTHDVELAPAERFRADTVVSVTREEP